MWQISPIFLQALLRARAIETQSYVLAAAQVGAHHEKRASYGHALAVDPWGVVLADCGEDKPGLTLVEIDLERVRGIRENMPLKKHCRNTSFYHSLEKSWPAEDPAITNLNWMLSWRPARVFKLSGLFF